MGVGIRLVGAAALLFMGVGTGCVATIKGEVDGDSPVGAKSGYFVVYDLGDAGYTVGIVLTNLTGACSRAIDMTYAQVEAYEDVDPDDPDWDELAQALQDIQEQYLPPEYWSYSIGVGVVEDLDDLVDGFDQDDGAYAGYCHVEDYIDYEEAFDDPEYEYPYECWSNGINEDGDVTDAEVEITAFTEDKSIKGTGYADLVNIDGEESGSLEFSFSVGFCDGLEDANEDLADAITDAFGG